MSVAMVGGLLVSSIVSGRLITADRAVEELPGRRHGRWSSSVWRCSRRIDDDHQPAVRRCSRWRARPRARRHRCRTSCSPSRTTWRSPTSAPPARWSRSSAPWAARSASPRSARCSPPGRHQRRRQPAPGSADRRHRHSTGAIPDLRTLPTTVQVDLRERLRRRDRAPLPRGRAVRRARAAAHDLHRGGPAAHHGAPRRRAGHQAGGAGHRRAGGDPVSAGTVSRTDTLLRLEQEVGVLVRRVRRVIGERARAVHPDLQPSSYLLLAHLAEAGAAAVLGRRRGARHRQGRGQPAGAAPRRPRPGRPDARPRRRPRHPRSPSTADAVRRLAEVRGDASPSARRTGSATGPTPTSTCSSARSAATTPRSTGRGADAGASDQPGRGVGRQGAVGHRGSWRRPLAVGQRDRPGAAVDHHGQRPAAQHQHVVGARDDLDVVGERRRVLAARGQRAAVERQRRALGRRAAPRPSAPSTRPAAGSTAARRPARSRTAARCRAHGIGTRQPSRPTSPVRNQTGSCRSLRRDVDLLEAELLALVEVRRAGQREHRQRGGAGAGQPDARPRRTGVRWRSTSWLLSTQVGERADGLDGRRACR